MAFSVVLYPYDKLKPIGAELFEAAIAGCREIETIVSQDTGPWNYRLSSPNMALIDPEYQVFPLKRDPRVFLPEVHDTLSIGLTNLRITPTADRPPRKHFMEQDYYTGMSSETVACFFKDVSAVLISLYRVNAPEEVSELTAHETGHGLGAKDCDTDGCTMYFQTDAMKLIAGELGAEPEIIRTAHETASRYICDQSMTEMRHGIDELLARAALRNNEYFIEDL